MSNLFQSIRAATTGKTLLLAVILLLVTSGNLFAQIIQSSTYQIPPKAIADLVDAPQTPAVRIDPTNSWMLILERPSVPTIEELAQPELRLAGLRIDPKIFGPSRESNFNGMSLKRISTGEVFPINGLPKSGKYKDINFSPDGNTISFVNIESNSQHLWVVDVSKRAARKLSSLRINDVYGSAYSWLSDNRTLIVKTIPENIGKVPQESLAPAGPVIEETSGRAAPARTYQDLLKNPHDERLFEYYLQSQLVRIDLSGKVARIGAPALYTRADASPSGKFLLVETIHPPFSYLVPLFRFPRRIEVWDTNGKLIKQIADLPLAEEVPVASGSTTKGPRSFGWRTDVASTLYWAEAQDGGDPKVTVDVRDKIFTLSEPFTSQPSHLISLRLRYAGIRWGENNLALVTEIWPKDRKTRTYLLRPDAVGRDTTLLFAYSSEDRYNNPGNPLSIPTRTGHSVLLTSTDGQHLYLVGDGASTEGDRPFLDEFNLSTRTSKRLWRSEGPFYERPMQFVDHHMRQIFTQRESQTEPPNYFLRDLATGDLRPVTSFPHPTPALANVQKDLIRYTRADGVKLSGTLYLPAGYKPTDGPLPLLMWAYPQEYKTADAAGQITNSPYRFVRLGTTSHLLALAAGYAVLDNPTMPIVGEGDREPNDTYVQQLVASAQAAVDEVVRRGVAERGRIAVGGHSYGAFMTANLLAHSDLFSAGIARSGAYNRTLTPFGFQSEDRTFWEAPDVYNAMSPFVNANKIKKPILMIHGEADNNAGTFPMQSERLFNALKGLGATARLVLLPHESHGYRARESALHVQWEMLQWMEKYVRSGPSPTSVIKESK